VNLWGMNCESVRFALWQKYALSGSGSEALVSNINIYCSFQDIEHFVFTFMHMRWRLRAFLHSRYNKFECSARILPLLPGLI
jgi:hypothetical protein